MNDWEALIMCINRQLIWVSSAVRRGGRSYADLIPAATDRVIRALCFSKLGDNASARSELDGAKSLVQSGLNIGYDRWNWPAWVFAGFLLQEADSLIPQAPLPDSPK